MVVLGFAHTGVRTAPSSDLMAYVAAGGSFADICGDVGDMDMGQGEKCAACRLLGATILPRDCDGAAVKLTMQTKVMTLIAQDRLQNRPRDPSHSVRAPPQA